MKDPTENLNDEPAGSSLLAEKMARLDDKLRAAGYDVKDAPMPSRLLATFPPGKKK